MSYAYLFKYIIIGDTGKLIDNFAILYIFYNQQRHHNTDVLLKIIRKLFVIAFSRTHMDNESKLNERYLFR